VALDLYLAYLRAAFNTCYYCSVTTDHVEELQRKCIQHIRKPLPKPAAVPEEQKLEVKMDTEPSAKEEAKEDGDEKQADAQKDKEKEKEKERKDNASKGGKERHSGKFFFV
jgi:outer membrane protein assembly factor BamE (lipoprotein component of BamABCDE complex)